MVNTHPHFKVPSIISIFRRSMQYIVNVLMVFIVLILLIGLFKTIYGIKDVLWAGSIGEAFNGVVADILTFLVVIELFRSFVDFFEVHRFRLNAMLDPAIIFVVREVIIKLYNHPDTQWYSLISLGLLILCLGIVRTLAVRYSPGDDLEPDVRK